MRYVNFTIVIIAFAVYVFAFAPEGLDAIIFALPFTMLPFMVTLVLAQKWRTTAGQIMLLLAAIAYCVWFAIVYLDVTVWHPDPNAAIAFVFVGIYAAPVLLLLWYVGNRFERRKNMG